MYFLRDIVAHEFVSFGGQVQVVGAEQLVGAVAFKGIEIFMDIYQGY